MLNRRILGGFIVVAMVLAAGLPAAAADIPLKNWSAPATWSPQASSGGGRTALALTQGPAVPLIPVAPCRVMDTRVGFGQTGAFGPPAIAAGVTRTISIPTHPTCTGVPSNANAYSLNVTVTNTGSGTYGYLQVWPTGQPQPTSSTINFSGPGVTLSNAALVQAGTSGQINVYLGNQSADVTIDINGYYSYNVTNSKYQSFPIITSTGPYAIYGNDNKTGGMGVWGAAYGSGGIGVKGSSSTYNGVWAESTSQDALFALGGRDGAYSQGARNGVVGASTGATGVIFGVIGYGTSTDAGAASVYGEAAGGAPASYTGYLSGGGIGVLAVSKNNYGLASASNYIGAKIFNLNAAGTQFGTAYLGESGYAARFYGNVLISSQGAMPGNLSVAGTLSKTTGSFKIDHPLDPANKYLYHSFVESPDMMNIYNGIIELDALGEAIVQLPTYFEALNSDFRYQLTSIGQAQSTLYIADEVQDLKFRIAGGKPHARVSWQVTGIRIDAYASAHRIVPEVVKEPEFKGYYLHPAEFGKPLSMSISERNAQMQDGKEAKEALKAQEASAKQ